MNQAILTALKPASQQITELQFRMMGGEANPDITVNYLNKLMEHIQLAKEIATSYTRWNLIMKNGVTNHRERLAIQCIQEALLRCHKDYTLAQVAHIVKQAIENAAQFAFSCAKRNASKIYFETTYSVSEQRIYLKRGTSSPFAFIHFPNSTN